MSTPSHSGPMLEPVPQLDLAAQYAAIGAEIRTAVERVMASQQLVLGREGAALEEEIAALCGVAHGVGLASGTDALILALKCFCRLSLLWPQAAPSVLLAQSRYSRTSGRTLTTWIPPNSNGV
jgi:hypothetical protein